MSTVSPARTAVGEVPAPPPGRPAVTRPWQVEDVLALPTGPRYEIVDGGLLIMPAPGLLHQWLCRQLFLQLHAQTSPAWEVTLDVGVRMSDDPAVSDFRIPDLTVGPSARRPSARDLLAQPTGVSLVIEVTVTTGKQDRILKPVEYAEAGIPWYWRLEVEPELELIAHELMSGGYVETGRYRAGVARPAAPIPLSVDLDALREPDDAGSGA